jgi:hypothetical protein
MQATNNQWKNKVYKEKNCRNRKKEGNRSNKRQKQNWGTGKGGEEMTKD